MVMINIRLNLICRYQVMEDLCQPALTPSSAISFVKAFMTSHKNENGLDPEVYSHSVLKEILLPVVWQNFPANVSRILMAAFPKEEVPQMSEDVLLPLLSSFLLVLAQCNKCCDTHSSRSVNQNNGEIQEAKNKVVGFNPCLLSQKSVILSTELHQPWLIAATCHFDMCITSEVLTMDIWTIIARKCVKYRTRESLPWIFL